MQLWRLEEAEAMLRGAIERNPQYISAISNLGVILQAMGKASFSSFLACWKVAKKKRLEWYTRVERYVVRHRYGVESKVKIEKKPSYGD